MKSKIVKRGVTALDAAEAGLVPTALVAFTLNVYAVPFVRPLIVALVAEAARLTGACAVAPMNGVIV